MVWLVVGDVGEETSLEELRRTETSWGRGASRDLGLIGSLSRCTERELNCVAGHFVYTVFNPIF